jgi:Plasmid stabilisation system protein.
MKRYDVKITDAALEDMESIYDYIALNLRAPATAMAQYDRIAEAILSLDVFPERYGEIGFSLKNGVKLRQMPVDNYSVFYYINCESVIVTDVLYSASDISNRLR